MTKNIPKIYREHVFSRVAPRDELPATRLCKSTLIVEVASFARHVAMPDWVALRNVRGIAGFKIFNESNSRASKYLTKATHVHSNIENARWFKPDDQSED